MATDAPLDVVVFTGGHGDEYATAQEARYEKASPQATIKHSDSTQISQEMQPRFVAGSPPDVLDDSGAQKIEYANLIDAGQLADLTPLLDAPSIDDPNVEVRDTLLPGTVEQGTFDGKVYGLDAGAFSRIMLPLVLVPDQEHYVLSQASPCWPRTRATDPTGARCSPGW